MFLPLRFFLLFGCVSAFAGPPPALSPSAKRLPTDSLAEWESPTPQLWKIEEGALTGGDGVQKIPHNDFLCARASYGNFILRLQIKLTGDPKTGMLNSGVQIRSKRLPKSHEVSGYQCDFGEPNWYGAIYDEGRRNKLLAKSDMAALDPALRRGEWNEYIIKADGRRIQTWINGVQAVDYTEQDETIPQEGIFGIQIHSGGAAKVQVKDVAIEELPPTPAEQRFIGAPEAGAAKKESPLSPEEERKTFTLPPGFEIELVAAESEGIGKFIAVDWDQRGRMWSMTAFEYPVDANENAERAKALYENPGKDKVLVFEKTAGPGPHAARVFADGLAIPLGILPQNEGVYVQHGPQIALLEDTDGDGAADRRRTLLTGFGVQDSHLFMHQFTRMPGGWIWGAQGAFNSGKVKTTTGTESDFPSTRMARFRPDGSQFEILCNGPCNIWGFAENAEGELFIQEANDFGYPVMPFQIGGNYPGCADRLFKSYAPDFPGTARDFRMGGTGLSGLALSDAAGSFPGAYANAMYVANPITRKIQAIRLRREGPRWEIAKLPDFIESGDPMFRPVAIRFGPDGALYIVDWYNKVISHNEVPRNHPDRDKVRGRIWRVKHQQQKPLAMPDLTKCDAAQVLAVLRGPSVRQGNLAWQAIVDRRLTDLVPQLTALVRGGNVADAERLRALWALEGLQQAPPALLRPLLADGNRNIRRSAIEVLARVEKDSAALLDAITPMATDPDPEVRAAVIRAASGFDSVGSNDQAVGVGQKLFADDDETRARALTLLIGMALPSLPGPIEPGTRNGKPTRVREAYDREFERYLVRQALEQNRGALAPVLSALTTRALPLEGRLLATLALEPRDSAAGLAELLPKLERAPNDEEILRLAQFPEVAGVGDALRALLENPKARTGVLEALLRVRNRLDTEKLNALLAGTAEKLLGGDSAAATLGLRLVSAFQLASAEPSVLKLMHGKPGADLAVATLETLSEIKSGEAPYFNTTFRTSKSPQIREAALRALAVSRAPEAPELLFGLWKDLAPAQRHTALDRLSSSKAGAQAITAAFAKQTIAADDLDGVVVDRLQTVLGNDEALTKLMRQLGSIFRPVLRLPGDANTSYAELEGITLAGPFTVETWVRLDPGIGNEDGILGSPGALDMNFFGERFRVWVGGKTHDAIVAKKKMAPDNWTHIAVTRQEDGNFRIYIDGELDNDQGKPAPQPFEKMRIGWTQNKKGAAGMLAEFRVWKRVRTPEEIRQGFDHAIDPSAKPDDLIFHAPGGGPWGRLQGKASVARTSDYPPLLTPQEAKALDEKFTKFRRLATSRGGDLERGKAIATMCLACHLIQGQGGNIAPNLSGAGAMGVEAILRNILTPNAAMEAGYRIFRVELKNGDLLDGFFVSEDATGTVVRLPGLPDRRLPKSEIRKTQYLRRSLMPEGLLDGLAPEQVTDLFAYLMSLKG